MHLKKLLFIFHNFFSAIIAGAFMGILNVLIDILHAQPDFKFYQLFSISMWHSVVWIIFSIFFILFNTIYYLIKKKNIINGLPSYLILYTYFSFSFLIMGYLNVKLLPPFFSLISILANMLIISLGILFCILIIKLLKTLEFKKFPVLLKVYIVLIAVILISSQVSNLYIERQIDSDVNLIYNDYMNVIIISLDAVRANHLGCYGYEKRTSPNIDKIASNGVLFENAFAQSSHTIESVPSLFSATYPSTHSMGSNTDYLPIDLILYPSIFKLNGYKTAIFSTMTYVSSAYGYDKCVDEFFELEKNIIRNTILASALSLDNLIVKKINDKIFGFSYSLFKSKYSLDSSRTDTVVKMMKSWISANKEFPFFLYAHLRGGHTPYGVPKEFESPFLIFPSEKYAKRPPNRRFSTFPLNKQSSVSNKELINMIAQYDSKIYYHDVQIGVLLDYLKSENLLNKTLLIITADHGEEFYDHFGWEHGNSLFDELIHVPLIIYGPGVILEGKRVKNLIEQVDIFPTICSLCNLSETIKFPYEIEGLDLSAMLLSNSFESQKEFIISELHKSNDSFCYRTYDEKAILIKSDEKNAYLFFNLLLDPIEKNNIYSKEDDHIQSIFYHLQSIIKRSKNKAFTPEKIKLDKRLKEQLRSLGYIK